MFSWIWNGGMEVRQPQQVSWLLSDACSWCVGFAGWPNCSFNYIWRLVLGALFLPWGYHHHSISAVHDSGQNSLLYVLDNARNLSAGTGVYVQFFCTSHGLSQPPAFFFTKTSRNSNYCEYGDRVNIWNADTLSHSVKAVHLRKKIPQNIAFVFRQKSLCICIQKCKSYRLPKRMQI